MQSISGILIRMMTPQHSRAMRSSISIILTAALCVLFQGCENAMPIEDDAVLGSEMELTVTLDGATTLVDGTMTSQGGTGTSVDGTMTSQGGFGILVDGTIASPNGTGSSADGTMTSPNGTGTSGDGTMTSQGGTGTLGDGITTSQGRTRTSVDGDWNTSWAVNDALSVFVTRYKKNSKNTVGHSKYSYKGNNVFTGTKDSYFASPYNWLAVYPYSDAGSTMQTATLTVEHPQKQTQSGNSNSHISGANDPLYGYCLNMQNQPSIRMHHIAAAVHFRIKNCTEKPIKVVSVQFTAPEAITGKFTSQAIALKDYRGEEIVWTGKSASNSVELSVPDCAVFSPDEEEDFYAAIHPTQANGDYTIVVRAISEGKALVFERTINAQFHFKAGKYTDVKVNFINPTEDTSMYCIENDALKAYLDKVERTPYFTSTTFAGYEGNYKSTLMTEDIYGTNSSTNRLDQPKPVTIMWEGTATDVDVFDTESRTSALPNEVVLRSGEADVYNLIPGKKYWYTVSNGSSTVAEGEFVPEGRRRMMKVCSTYGATYAGNCRDLGGLPVMGGHSVKYGLIYRGTNLDSFKTNSEMRDVLLNVMGIKLDVDLRNHEQATSALDLTSYGIISDYQDYGYADLTDLQNPVKVKATLTAIMSSVLAGKPVYIHCKIGSDRTGYFCMLIEALLGVEQNWTDTDYELTSFASAITSGSRTRNRSGDNKYKDALNLFSGFNGTTLQDKVYDYVVTSKASKALQMDKATVDAFISAMVE